MKGLMFICFLLVWVSGYTQNSQKRIDEAVSLAEKKKFVEALKILDKVIEKDSVNYDALIIRSIVYSNIDSVLNCYNDLSKVIRYYPDSAAPYYHRGNLLYALNYFDESIEDFSRALELTNENDKIHGIYIARGNSKFKKRDFQGAYEDSFRAYLIDTTDVNVFNNIAMSLDELNRKEEAIVFLKKVIQERPKSLEGWINLGFQHGKLGKFEESLTYLNKAVDLNPESAVALNNRGYTRLMLNDTKGAMEDINKSLKLYPGNSYGYRNRALVYLAQGEKQKACEDIETGLNNGFTQEHGDELLELKKKHCN